MSSPSRLFDPLEMHRRLPGLAGWIRELPLAHPGVCSDCKREGPRHRYGTAGLELCGQCSGRRLAAAATTLPDEEFATLRLSLKKE